MKNDQMKNLIGTSFEELSIEEMERMQGAGGDIVNSTPTVVAISTIEVSEALSALASATLTISAAVTKTKCKK
ncbi:MAG: lichenicidin A2 family type 2 lantibiotic [Lactobacillaceae bacterium]|jgi:type 2 lantibiotic (TIGR03893 family)|nr:lichenicidin A2 family type 2 lantibiotic [Lactobacillaceae bacterium]